MYYARRFHSLTRFLAFQIDSYIFVLRMYERLSLLLKARRQNEQQLIISLFSISASYVGFSACARLEYPFVVFASVRSCGEAHIANCNFIKSNSFHTISFKHTHL